MIISKKKFKEEIEIAVKEALNRKEEEIRMIHLETELNRRIDDLSGSTYDEISKIRDRIDDMEENIWKAINDIKCKMSHKKSRLNG